MKNFIGANLFHKASASEFKLSLHRTEVCRLPVNPPGTSPDALDRPIFPLQKKFYYLNKTLEGLEEVFSKERKYQPRISDKGNPDESLYADRVPSGEDGDDEKAARAQLVNPGSPLYKYDARGRRLPIDEHGRWIRTTGNWRPVTQSKFYFESLKPTLERSAESKRAQKSARLMLKRLKSQKKNL